MTNKSFSIFFDEGFEALLGDFQTQFNRFNRRFFTALSPGAALLIRLDSKGRPVAKVPDLIHSI